MPTLPTIPEFITVHLGAPDENAQNVTLPFAEYIANVASSEVYPTWPESAVRANIYAQLSFALNRVYTEFYRSRGYDFDITSSTAYDQSFVNGRNVFSNIEEIVSEIFNSYIRRRGNIEPLFAAYCDGVEVRCNGLSQWGSVTLAEEGYTPYGILTYYYGDDIDIISGVDVEGASASAPTYPLSVGSTGDAVRILQLRLNRISDNYPSIPKVAAVDGIFTNDTEAAVIRFQEIFGLTPDGIAGPATLAKIGLPTGSNSSYQSNVNLLARVISGEARGESYTGQVAIAAVVLNRVKHSSFPSSIAGVIYQPGAFTAVSDGQINITPTQSCYNAARDALNGWDPTGGSIYYYNPQTATNAWIRSRTIITRIGKHVFCI